MKLCVMNSRIWLVVGMMAASLCLPVDSRAQTSGNSAGNPGMTSNTLTQRDADLTTNQIMEKSLGDPIAEEAYQAFHNAKDADKKIKLGEDYINQYPSDRHIQAAYDELTQAYSATHDMENFYKWSDKGISLFPDDVTLLAMTGWVIPRAYRPDDPDGEARLGKAEKYAKHAIEVLNTMQPPTGMPQQQFDQYKTEELSTAHSALGLVYFRQEKFEDSTKEIQEATQGTQSPDPTDFFVLGAAYQNLNQYKEAADAFNRCAQMPGGLQANCKQNADNATKLAAQSK